jgi:hypothetical protein
METVGLFEREEACRAVNEDAWTEAEVQTVLHRLRGNVPAIVCQL